MSGARGTGAGRATGRFGGDGAPGAAEAPSRSAWIGPALTDEAMMARRGRRTAGIIVVELV